MGLHGPCQKIRVHSAHTRRHLKEHESLTATDYTLLCRHSNTPGEKLKGHRVSLSTSGGTMVERKENIVLKQYRSNSFGNASLPDWKIRFSKKKMLIRRHFLNPT